MLGKTLDDRSQEILGELISDYIATADAVGSVNLAKRLQYRLSPATIRNVMSDLEERGYLAQLHTSAGRIPTEKGLRYYVNTCLKAHELSSLEQDQITQEYQIQPTDIRSLIQKTSNVLASISKHVGLILAPKWEKTVFKHMEFLPLSHGKLLGIFVSQGGRVENRILDVKEELNYLELEKINNYCNASFIGLTLEEAHEKISGDLKKIHTEYDRLLSKALLFSSQLMQSIQTTELMIDGEPPVERLKSVLKTLKEKEKLLALLDSCANSSGVNIFIGAESQCEATKELSLITATYKQGEKLVGTLGVIGPKNMDYSKIISIVDFTSRMLSDSLSQS